MVRRKTLRKNHSKKANRRRRATKRKRVRGGGLFSRGLKIHPVQHVSHRLTETTPPDSQPTIDSSVAPVTHIRPILGDIDKIKQAVELEIQYSQDCLPRGILGLTAPMFRDYVQYIADRRLERIGLKAVYRSKNPFPWMSETIDLGKEKNFFETRVTEYQSASNLTWT
jgi:hypothetical protein